MSLGKAMAIMFTMLGIVIGIVDSVIYTTFVYGNVPKHMTWSAIIVATVVMLFCFGIDIFQWYLDHSE